MLDLSMKGISGCFDHHGDIEEVFVIWRSMLDPEKRSGSDF